MEQVKCVQIVIFSAVILTGSLPVLVAFPTPTVSAGNDPPTPLFRNVVSRNFNIVEGPKEFLLPLAPLKSILMKHLQTKTDLNGGEVQSGNISDLDYMVYGKVYLMKALVGISSRSGGGSESSAEVTAPTPADDILFPTQSTATSGKRPYRYKYWYTPKPSDYKDTTEGSVELENRKLEVRSVGSREQDEDVSSSPESDLITQTGDGDSTLSLSSLQTPASTAEPKLVDFMADEEALELLKRLMPEALAFHENDKGNPTQSPLISNDGAIQGSGALMDGNSNNNSSGSSGGGSIDVDNRFLIHVPQKPNCPDGQKRNHRGICKPIFVYNPSSQDDTLIAKRLTAASAHHRHVHTSGVADANNNGNDNAPKRNFQLTALFSSFLKLEKSLEKAAKDAEQKLDQLGGLLKEEESGKEKGNDDGEMKTSDTKSNDNSQANKQV